MDPFDEGLAARAAIILRPVGGTHPGMAAAKEAARGRDLQTVTGSHDPVVTYLNRSSSVFFFCVSWL